MSEPSVYDHYRPTDTPYADGIYRVVGTDDGVTLLRVADAGGRRVNTGELLTADADAFEGFVPAANPDDDRSMGAVVASTVEAAYWSVRVFGRQVAANPVPSAVAAAFVLAGIVGDQFVRLPDAAFGASIVVGSLGLAYVGGGRL